MVACCLSLAGRLLAPLLAGLGALAALPAQAGDVYWSVGVGSPGVGATVSNAPPVVYAPAPVVVAPAPVYTPPPRVVYTPPPRVVYAPPPTVVYAPAPVYVVPEGRGRKHKHKHHHHHHGEWRQGWQHHGAPVGYVRHEGGWRR